MLVPRVTRCGDGHFRRVIYGLGPYIADYPEQALLACIVQGWCPRYVKNLTFYLLLNHGTSCTASPDNLDEPSGRRSHEHTDVLLEACSLHELWDNYGIVGDVIVSISQITFH
jgi:Plavaka transposase